MRIWQLSIFMIIGEHGPALIDVRKTLCIWGRREDDELNAEADLTVEESLSCREGRCLT